MKKRNQRNFTFIMALCVSAALSGYIPNVATAQESNQSVMAEVYGMTYDKEKDRFFYNGKIVRYFKDQESAENTNSFFFGDGVVDVEPIRNASGILTGLKQSSDADFNAKTEKHEEMKVEFEKVGIDANSSCCELGDPNYCDDSLDVYTPFGVSYDKATKKWMYDGKIIHVLYDEDYSLYCDSSANDGINLKVIRDKNHNIEKLVKMEE